MFRYITAFLFDLDGTLIHYDVEKFLLTYAIMASKHFKDIITTEKFVPLFLNSGRRIVHNLGPKTNIDFFLSDFTAHIHLSPEETLRRLQIFFETEFNLLHDMVKPDPFASAILNTCQQAGYKVIIATSPVFPEATIRIRLRWAVDSSFKPDFITTAENMHTSKPSTAYYGELCTHLDLNPINCLMIGNSIEEDIIPAQKLGMKTYLIISNDEKEIRSPVADSMGTLEDLFKKLKEFIKY